MTAIDAAGAQDGEPPLAEGPRGIVTMRNVLPDWAVRLLVGALLLPALLVALDAFFRARRRRAPVLPWVRLARDRRRAGPGRLAVAWLLGCSGALPAPDGPVLPGAFPLDTAGALALASLVPVGAGAWCGGPGTAGRERARAAARRRAAWPPPAAC